MTDDSDREARADVVEVSRDIAQQLVVKLGYVAEAFPGDKQTRDTLIPALEAALAAARRPDAGLRVTEEAVRASMLAVFEWVFMGERLEDHSEEDRERWMNEARPDAGRSDEIEAAYKRGWNDRESDILERAASVLPVDAGRDEEAMTLQTQRNEWREAYGRLDQETSNKIAAMEAHVRRLSGCLLAIAGAPSRIGGGSIRTAAYEAPSMGASVDDIARKVGNPVANLDADRARAKDKEAGV